MKRFPPRFILALSVCLLALGCESRYDALRFRPIDTNSDLIIPNDVQVMVSRNHGQPALAGTTDEHGHIQLKDLRAGDQILFVSPGFEKALLILGLAEYTQRSPESSGKEVKFFLQENDTIPVPLHRTGEVEKPSPLAVPRVELKQKEFVVPAVR